jgi:hypothetical protein
MPFRWLFENPLSTVDIVNVEKDMGTFEGGELEMM